MIKDGWIITDDPYYIISPGLNYPVDLGAEKIIGAMKDNKKIAVEVKNFLAESLSNEFHMALGQYLDYETGIEDQEPDREIYLAMPDVIWEKIQKFPLLIKNLNKYTVDMLIYNIETKTVVEWIKK